MLLTDDASMTTWQYGQVNCYSAAELGKSPFSPSQSIMIYLGPLWNT